MRLTPEILREISHRPPSELCSVDESSVAYLATDGLIYSLQTSEQVIGRSENRDLRPLLRWEMIAAA